MRVFLDSSVILSACGSDRALSHLFTVLAAERNWHMVSAAYCRAETVRNLAKFPKKAGAAWECLQARIEWVPNALTSMRPLILAVSKDKPVLISALAAECNAFLTLDTGDFGIVSESTVYGMRVSTPRDFLTRAGLG